MALAADENDISAQRTWYGEERAKLAIANFEKRRINARYAANQREALAAILEMIPAGASVSRADSMTLDQLDVWNELRKRKQNTIRWAQEKDDQGNDLMPDLEDRKKLQREALLADVFLTGSNAVTLDGKLVNTDGFGNRVAPMIFGPKKVIVVAGVNKIVKDVNEALVRIREMCAPLNARRHFEKHHRPWYGSLPCVQSATCTDYNCEHERKICNITVVIEGNSMHQEGRMNVVLVGEDLGI